jgi:hypothetical protein
MSDETHEMKLVQMLKSKDPEMYRLGLTICQKEYPAIWAGLVNFTGIGEITDEALATINTYNEINIGTVVRFRGMSGSPDMVVVDARLESIKGARTPGYKTLIKCRYYNKSKQSFETIEERIECFDVVPQRVTVNNTKK